MLGSMFSESESSGEGALRLRFGVDVGARALDALEAALCTTQNRDILPFCLFLMLCKLRSLDSSKIPKG